MKHLKEFVKSVPDYRRTDKGNYKYKLEDILLLVILGRLGKCMTRPDIIRFSERNLKRFRSLAYIIHSGFISGYQNRYGDNLKPPTNVYHRMTA